MNIRTRGVQAASIIAKTHIMASAIPRLICLLPGRSFGIFWPVWAFGTAVSATRLHRVGRGFESLNAHHLLKNADGLVDDWILGLRVVTSSPSGGRSFHFDLLGMIWGEKNF